jgi:hypothetical protein
MPALAYRFTGLPQCLGSATAIHCVLLRRVSLFEHSVRILRDCSTTFRVCQYGSAKPSLLSALISGVGTEKRLQPGTMDSGWQRSLAFRACRVVGGVVRGWSAGLAQGAGLCLNADSFWRKFRYGELHKRFLPCASHACFKRHFFMIAYAVPLFDGLAKFGRPYESPLRARPDRTCRSRRLEQGRHAFPYTKGRDLGLIQAVSAPNRAGAQEAPRCRERSFQGGG